MLELLSLLQSGRAQSGPELARRLGVSARTLRRDVERLRGFGYAVGSAPGTGGSYRLLGGHGMPPLLLTDDEAVATVVGLRHAAAAYGGAEAAAAASALGKIEQVVPSRVRHRVESVAASTEPPEPPAGAPDDRTLAALRHLAPATHTHAHVRFRYTARDGRESGRRVEPYRLVLLRHRWYLLCWDLDREDWRSFRVGAMREVGVPGTTFTPRPVPEGPFTGAPGADGSVLFDAPLSVVTRRLTAEAGTLEAVGTDRCRYRTDPDDWDWLAGIVAAVAVPYTVESPAELAEATRRMTTRATRATRTARATGGT
ncbi:WYL domain-containing protein [Streptomyces sp. HNM0574]|nr:WYL domain-containing protein [Streptomyces sp. HNM0574]